MTLHVCVIDLKAFERRLTDVISHLQPITVRWRGRFYVDVSLLFSEVLYFSDNKFVIL